jgi:Holliday junction resolvase
MINSRAKGARGEREFRDFIKEHGYEARRGQQFCGSNGDADVVGLDGIHIEVKRVENLNIDKALEQSADDAEAKGLTPIVAHRRDRKMWKVTMYAEDWIRMYKEWRDSHV